MRIAPLPTVEEPTRSDAGLGTLRTERGNLPLERIDAASPSPVWSSHTVADAGLPQSVRPSARGDLHLPAARSGLR